MAERSQDLGRGDGSSERVETVARAPWVHESPMTPAEALVARFKAQLLGESYEVIGVPGEEIELSTPGYTDTVPHGKLYVRTTGTTGLNESVAFDIKVKSFLRD